MRREDQRLRITNANLAHTIPSWSYNSVVVGRRGMEITSADSMIASAMAALRDVTVRCCCEWLESASNQTKQTRTGDQSHSARRHGACDHAVSAGDLHA